MSADTGTAAACSKLTFAGLRASLPSWATAYSAKVPPPMPNTSSPTGKLVTAEPTDDDRPGDIEPGHRVLRPADPEYEAQQVREAGHQVPDAAVEAGRVHVEQHLTVADRGRGDPGQPQNVGVAVALLHDRLASCSPPLGGLFASPRRRGLLPVRSLIRFLSDRWRPTPAVLSTAI